jgi:hypothetical protein
MVRLIICCLLWPMWLAAQPPVRSWANISQFGAVGDGRTDDSPALLRALAHCQQHRTGLLLSPGKTYLLQKPIYWSFEGVLAMQPAGPGPMPVLRCADTLGREPFWLTARPCLTTRTLTQTARPGHRTLHLSNTTDLRPGDLLELHSARRWPIEDAGFRGETNVVERIQGKTVWLRYPCADTYTPADPPTLNYRGAELWLRDIAWSCTVTNVQKPVEGLHLEHLSSLRATGLVVRNFNYTGIQIRSCVHTLLTSCYVEGANMEGQGYAFAVLGGQRHLLRGNVSVGCRKAIDFSQTTRGGPCRQARAEGNTAIGQGKTHLGHDWFEPQTPSFGFATHGGAEDIMFRQNVVVNCATGFQTRGLRVQVLNNYVFGRSQLPVSLSGGSQHLIEGNSYRPLFPADTSTAAKRAAKLYPDYFLSIGDAYQKTGQVFIRRNRADSLERGAIYGENLGPLRVIDGENKFNMRLYPTSRRLRWRVVSWLSESYWLYLLIIVVSTGAIASKVSKARSTSA